MNYTLAKMKKKRLIRQAKMRRLLYFDTCEDNKKANGTNVMVMEG